MLPYTKPAKRMYSNTDFCLIIESLMYRDFHLPYYKGYFSKDHEKKSIHPYPRRVLRLVMTKPEGQAGTWAIEGLSGFWGEDEARLKMSLGCRLRNGSIQSGRSRFWIHTPYLTADGFASRAISGSHGSEAREFLFAGNLSALLGAFPSGDGPLHCTKVNIVVPVYVCP